MKIILGSASKWRAQIMQEAGFDFEVMAANIDEQSIRHDDARQLALDIANAKADALLPKIKGQALLITVDEVVTCNGELFEKPKDADEARHFMHCYNQHRATTLTAVVVANTATRKRVSGVDIARVHFKTIPEEEIERLITAGEIFHCAGGFQVEGENGDLNSYVRNVDGDVDSVKGLPMRLVERLLQQANAQHLNNGDRITAF